MMFQITSYISGFFILFYQTKIHLRAGTVSLLLQDTFREFFIHSSNMESYTTDKFSSLQSAQKKIICGQNYSWKAFKLAVNYIVFMFLHL